jgi:hypothetical protein
MKRSTVWRVAGATLVARAGVSIGTVASGTAASPVYGTYVPQSSTLMRAPYVTDLTQTSAEVNWATSNSTPGMVLWGTPANCFAHGMNASTALPAFQPDIDHANAVTPQVSTKPAIFQFSTQLSGLTAGSPYCYSVWTSGSGSNLLGSGNSQSFSTLDASTSTAPLTFDVVGDLGETNGADESTKYVNEDQAAIDTEIGQSGAKFLVTTGDMGYSGGTDPDYGDLSIAPTSPTTELSNIFGPTYWPETGGIPTFAGDGNHGQIISGLRTWPEEQTAANDGPTNPGTYALTPQTVDGVSGSYPDSWYAFSDGGVRIYVLDVSWGDAAVGTDTNGLCTSAQQASDDCKGYQMDDDAHWQPSSAEMKWLQADLATHPGGIKMAAFHYPVESDNSTQPSDPYLTRDLVPVLEAGGVQMVFNGHAHTYQRFAPTGSGLISYVTGGGGGVLEPVQGGSTCASFTSKFSVYALGMGSHGVDDCGQTAPAMVTAKDANGNSYSYVPGMQAAQVYNFLKITVNSGAVTVAPENALGATFDQQTYQLETVTPPTTTTTTTTSTPTTTTTTQPTTTTTTQPTQSSIAEVQRATAASSTVPLTTTQSGDTLVLESNLDTGATNLPTGVTDSSGLDVGKWTQIGKAFATGGHVSYGDMWYLPNAPAGITSVTLQSKTTVMSLAVQEFSGLGTAPTVVSTLTPKPTDPAATSTTVSATVTASGGLAVGFAAGHANSQIITPTGTGYMNQQGAATASTTLETGYDLSVTGGATYSAKSAGAMYWAGGVAILTPGG